MCVCLYACVYLYIYLYVFTHTYMYVCIHTYAYICRNAARAAKVVGLGVRVLEGAFGCTVQVANVIFCTNA